MNHVENKHTKLLHIHVHVPIYEGDQRVSTVMISFSDKQQDLF